MYPAVGSCGQVVTPAGRPRPGVFPPVSVSPRRPSPCPPPGAGGSTWPGSSWPAPRPSPRTARRAGSNAGPRRPATASSQTSMVPVNAPVTVHRCPFGRGPRPPSAAGRATTAASSPDRRPRRRRRPGRRRRTSRPRSGCCSSLTSFTQRAEPAVAAGCGRLGWRIRVTASQHRGEVRTVREFSVPARFTVGEHDNVVGSVFAHERDDPDHVIYSATDRRRHGPTSPAPRSPPKSVRPHWV